MCHAQVKRSISEILRFAQNDRIMSKCDESQAGCLCHDESQDACATMNHRQDACATINTD